MELLFNFRFSKGISFHFGNLITLVLISCSTPTNLVKPTIVLDDCAKDKSVQTNFGSMPITLKGGETYVGNDCSAAFFYVIDLDSFLLKYTATELLHNGKKLTLADWCEERWLDTFSLQNLNLRSASDTFTVKGGDSISLYREYWWYNPTTKKSDAYKFYTPSFVGIAIELRDELSDERIALIDSMSFEAQQNISQPKLYSKNPTVAKVAYELPLYYQSTTATVRYILYQSDSVKKGFARKDIKTMGLSQHLKIDGWIKWKEDGEIIKEFHSKDKNSGFISCFPSVSTNGSFSVQLQQPQSAELLIKVLNSNGTEILRQKVQPTVTSSTLYINEKGVFIVTISDAFGKLLGTTKVINQ